MPQDVLWIAKQEPHCLVKQPADRQTLDGDIGDLGATAAAENLDTRA